MKPRPPAEDEDGGLDSLMDTMTNVVGILILVLVMTQLDVQEILRQVTEKSNVTAADLEAAKERLEQLKQDQTQLQSQASSFDPAAEQERLKRMQETLAAKRQALKTEKEQSNQFALALDSDRKMAAKNQQEIAGAEAQRGTLETSITEALKKKADLLAKLDKTPKRSGPAPSKVVSIPNPRPAPPGAKQISFICANNRLYPMNVDEIRADAEQKVKDIVVKHRLNLDPNAGIDLEKFEKFFSKLTYPTDDFLSVEYYIADKRYPRLRLTPKDDKGAADEELQKPRSRIRKLLSTLDPSKVYAMFYVLPDSYDVYITARQVMMEANIQAGWDPLPQTWVYTTSIPGGVELGPPRPVPPKPTTPTPPTPPANVID